MPPEPSWRRGEAAPAFPLPHLAHSHFLDSWSPRPLAEPAGPLAPAVSPGQAVSRDGVLGECVPREAQQARSHSLALPHPPCQPFDQIHLLPPRAHVARPHLGMFRLSLAPSLLLQEALLLSPVPPTLGGGAEFLPLFQTRPLGAGNGFIKLGWGGGTPSRGCWGRMWVPGKVGGGILDAITRGRPPGVCVWGRMMSVPYSLINVYRQGGAGFGGSLEPSRQPLLPAPFWGALAHLLQHWHWAQRGLRCRAQPWSETAEGETEAGVGRDWVLIFAFPLGLGFHIKAAGGVCGVCWWRQRSQLST